MGMLTHRGIDLLGARLVSSAWLEASHESCLLTRGITWADHLTDQKLQAKHRAIETVMTHTVDKYKALINRYHDFEYSDPTILWRILASSPLLYLITLVITAARADDYIPDSVPLVALFAPSFIAGLATVVYFCIWLGCWPILQEFYLCRRYSAHVTQLNKLWGVVEEPFSEGQPADRLLTQSEQPKVIYHAQWPTARTRADYRSAGNQIDLDVGNQISRLNNWNQTGPCRPIYTRSYWYVQSGLFGGLFPLTFVGLLFGKLAAEWPNWYCVLAPWMIFGCFCLFLPKLMKSKRLTYELLLTTSIVLPMLFTLSTVAARAEEDISWPFWSCFIPMDLVLFVLAVALLWSTFPQDQSMILKAGYFLLHCASIWTALGAVVLFPLCLDGVVTMPYTVLAAVLSATPFVGIIFIVYVYI